jgi:hypothetical protein
MQHLIDSIEQTINTKNWYAALMLALTIPDITGKIDSPNTGSNKRYADWFDIYLGEKYKAMMGQPKTEYIFLSGNDCYALRCSFLHEGKSKITHQRAREVLEDFQFNAPLEGMTVHCNSSGNKLQLQVDIFSKDIIEGIQKWLIDIKDDAQKQLELNKFLNITQIREGALRI